MVYNVSMLQENSMGTQNQQSVTGVEERSHPFDAKALIGVRLHGAPREGDVMVNGRELAVFARDMSRKIEHLSRALAEAEGVIRKLLLTTSYEAFQKQRHQAESTMFTLRDLISRTELSK